MAHARRLLTRHDATPLVHLEVSLGEPTRRVVSRSVHNLSARSDRLDVHLYLQAKIWIEQDADPMRTQTALEGDVIGAFPPI